MAKKKLPTTTRVERHSSDELSHVQPSALQQDFDAFILKHGVFIGSAVLVMETLERDDNGNKRWIFLSHGGAAESQLMLAHALGLMSARQERKIAEALRASTR